MGGPLDGMRYAPGDHHVYVWDGHEPTVRVYRVEYGTALDGGLMRREVDTGERLPAPTGKASVAAMARHVDLTWRGVAVG